MKLNPHFLAVLGAAVTINAMAQKPVTLTQADLRSGNWKTDVTAGETLDITLSADVTAIPADAFADAPVVRVDGTPARRLTKVGAYAFARCKELRELLLPESVTTMGGRGASANVKVWNGSRFPPASPSCRSICACGAWD